MKLRISWLAGDPAGLGHARFGREPRTACGERAIDERHAWPIRARCPAIDKLDLADGQAIRIGRFRITRSAVAARHVEFDTDPTSRLTIELFN